MDSYASACGKCILLGEHSILEGGSAIALPLTKYKIEIQFKEEKQNKLNVNFPLNENDEKLFWSLLKEDFTEINTQGHYSIQTKLPIGAGLGSSAALCVALNRLFRKSLSPQELIEKAWKSEFRFHGKSSGIDPTTIATEKAIHFSAPNNFSEIVFTENFKSQYIFILFDSLLRRSTQSVVQQNKAIQESNPDVRKKTIPELQQLVLDTKNALEKNEIAKVGSYMNKAHFLLSEMGVSNEGLNKLQTQTLEYGALGAKLTGAGRGGFLLALFDLNTWQSLKTRNHSKLGSFFELQL